jgi:predicted DNA-binding transcriptional regulator AlpA
MAKRIVREPEACNRLGCRRTTFRTNYRLNDPADPNVPSTTIPRVKPIPLGPRNVGFAETDLDALIDALVEGGGHTESKAKKRKTARAASAPQSRRKRK